MKLKQFLKAKKGKELIEVIVLFPVMLFLILYSVINVVCYIVRAQAEDITTNYARCAVTERTFYKALCSIATEMEKNNYQITVLEIVITDDTGIKYTMKFSDNDVETTYFKNLVYEDRDGKIAFNVNSSDSLNEQYRLMANVWTRGNYVLIKTEQGIAPIISSISKVSIYNFSEKKTETFDYGMSGVIDCEATSVIIS